MNNKDESMGQTIQNTRVMDGRVVGYYGDDGDWDAVLEDMITEKPPYVSGANRQHPQPEDATIRFGNVVFRFELQGAELRLYAADSTLKTVRLPLRGDLKAIATHRTKDGTSFLFVIVKEHNLKRYALVVIDNTFQCLGFYAFPRHIRTTPYFVKNSQGVLFIVPINALLSINEGVFRISL